MFTTCGVRIDPWLPESYFVMDRVAVRRCPSALGLVQRQSQNQQLTSGSPMIRVHLMLLHFATVPDLLPAPSRSVQIGSWQSIITPT
jgi:hypothetical protein